MSSNRNEREGHRRNCAIEINQVAQVKQDQMKEK